MKMNETKFIKGDHNLLTPENIMIPQIFNDGVTSLVLVEDFMTRQSK